jgi:hypothetical protein
MPAIAACVVLRLLYPPSTLPAIMLEGGLVGVVYLAAVCTFGFDKGARTRYLDYVRSILASPRSAAHPVAEGAS